MDISFFSSVFFLFLCNNALLVIYHIPSVPWILSFKSIHINHFRLLENICLFFPTSSGSTAGGRKRIRRVLDLAEGGVGPSAREQTERYAHLLQDFLRAQTEVR